VLRHFLETATKRTQATFILEVIRPLHTVTIDMNYQTPTPVWAKAGSFHYSLLDQAVLRAYKKDTREREGRKEGNY